MRERIREGKTGRREGETKGGRQGEEKDRVGCVNFIGLFNDQNKVAIQVGGRTGYPALLNIVVDRGLPLTSFIQP
jgi:hypothetical protein